MPFIHEDFLLGNAPARRLYHDWAEAEPILDYHNHLPPQDIARNRAFNDLFEAWLEGDHYKWRAMRTNGVPEALCTGKAEPYAKFLAWAGTVPHTLRNPLYHWTHLELQRYFGVDELLNEKTAPAIWEQANAALKTPQLTTQGILRKFNVRALCTNWISTACATMSFLVRTRSGGFHSDSAVTLEALNRDSLTPVLVTLQQLAGWHVCDDRVAHELVLGRPVLVEAAARRSDEHSGRLSCDQEMGLITNRAGSVAALVAASDGESGDAGQGEGWLRSVKLFNI